MTIQINVLLWTVICFCAFMLILWRLLLKPMLAFMDARKARIAHARSLDRTGEREAERARLEQQRQEEARRLAEERRQAVLALQEENRAAQEAREKAYRQDALEQRAAFEAEASALAPELAVSLSAHVEAFTEKLAAFGER